MACAPLTLWLATVLHVLHVDAGVASLSPSGITCPQTAVAEDSADESAISLLARRARTLLNRRDPLPPIVFVKTHKVGGSTMCNILQRVAAREHMRPVLPTDGGVINWQKVEATQTAEHQYDIVFNHEMFNETAVRRFMKPEPFFLSIVREPVAMIDSRFRWHKGATTWAERLEEMSWSPNLYMNPMARDFGWYDCIDIRRLLRPSAELYQRDEDQAAIEAFVERINRTMDFVFPTENYDEGLVLLKDQLPLTLEDLIYFRQKEGPAYEIPPPTPEEEEALRKYVRIDTLLYQTFKQRFEEQRRLAQERHFQLFQSEVRELQTRNAETQQACDATPVDDVRCPEELYLTPNAFNSKYFVD